MRADHAQAAAPPRIGGKFAFVSNSLPPAWSGQSVVIGRLLAPVDPKSYCLVTQQPAASDREQWIAPLMARCHRLPREPAAARLSRPRAVAPAVLGDLAATVMVRAARIAGIARREGCEAIVGATADIANLPAAFLAAKLIGARFYAYLFDSYEFQWLRPIDRRIAHRLSRLMFRRADGIVVPNEALRGEIERRHGANATIVPNPFEHLAGPATESRGRADGEITILFSGAVYHVNAGALRNLVGAMALAGLKRVRFDLYTAQSAEQLAAYGIVGERVFVHAHVPPAEVAMLQQQADMLFLPYAFDSPVPEIIRTSTPSKMSDYLAAARPILVHAGADALVCDYFRAHRCGIVVDRDQPGALGVAIAELIADPALRADLASRARQRALADFDPDQSRRRFLSLVAGSSDDARPRRLPAWSRQPRPSAKSWRGV
jgi:glycosyltransferase involved in cell wall biosynthesis